ncbi:uncharacterized protein N7511_001443 [Penicillium nucicola]|uniref:uncharacterized protein n=1 Tax=Penicillium nucicola TaxID=1850975 RepID=UPI0025455A3A|nr:uncharacterized protein N7511_001443 [Penicillium nucicola]KAJ5776432.1 hypothetical protein N7511_001443 [Penicillium nucicola]
MPSAVCSSEFKAELSGILQRFLCDVNYQILPANDDSAIDEEVKQYFQNQALSDFYLAKLTRAVNPSLVIAKLAYQSTPFDVRVAVAIFTTYSIAIDDAVDNATMRDDLKQFSRCLLSGQKQKNEMLESYAKFLSNTIHATFGQFSGDLIIKDALQFISACYVEAECKETLEFPASAPDFANYFRLKTGEPEAYAVMLFPSSQFTEHEFIAYCLPAVPYLISLMDWGNDIMSFYKECQERDTCNFVTNSSKSHGQTPIQFLQTLCDDLVDAICHLREIGKSHPKLSASLESIISGYMLYHITAKRYRLAELDIFPSSKRLGVL